MTTLEIQEAIVEMIRLNSVELRSDVLIALDAAREREAPDSNAARAFADIKNDLRVAKRRVVPLCQDTGALSFYVHRCGDTHSAYSLEKAIQGAVAIATAKGYLRRNCIDTATGRSIPSNVFDTMPTIHFEACREGELIIALIQKGGGCENVSAQYSLPDDALNAERNLDGVYRVAMNAILAAEGKGCAPGVLGVCIGGDRELGYHLAKRQLFRALDDTNENEALARLEAKIVADANALGIGPMGLGGGTTLLAAKIAFAPRIPASYFVSVSYNCWALRRRTLTVREGEYEID